MFTNTLNALSKNMHLAIIALYAYVLLNHVKEDQYVVMIFLTLATCMAICYLKKNRVEGFGHNKDAQSITAKRTPSYSI